MKTRQQMRDQFERSDLDYSKINNQMTEQEFEKHLEWRLNEIKRTLIAKGKEYRRNNNPFHNFEKGAQITGQSPERVLDGFLLKHIVSYRDMLDDIDKGEIIPKGLVNEKFGDIINYFIIQEIMFWGGNNFNNLK